MTTNLMLRIIVGGILGGLIGLEREYRAKEAGFRTHFLVALGSTLLTVISAYGYDTILQLYPKASFDPTRITAQIVSGIGFIGAGIIIFQKNAVHGLTTAAGLWVTSAIGIAAGVGHYDFAVASTVMVLLALEALNFVIHRFGARAVTVTFSSPHKEYLRNVLEQIRNDGIEIESYSMENRHDANGHQYVAEMELRVRRYVYESRLMELMQDIDGITIENIE